MVTTWAAARAGISSGCSAWTTSAGPVSRSMAGQPCRCQRWFSTRTGIRWSETVAPIADATSRGSRSFHELENRTSASPGDCCLAYAPAR